jgi:hypothetical protein
LGPNPIERAWDYWVRHVEKAGLMPERPAAKRKAAAAAKKAAPKKAGAKAKPAKKSGSKKRR